jgi:G3E family GTPase
MRTVVVSGLLGAGKTTFIRNYAGRVSGKAVVLVNDFGRAGIDGEIFSSEGIESIELPSGCVCCTLKFDLITTLKSIREHLSPDNLLIEPSGIASPSGVIEVLTMLGIAPVTVVGIVDAAEFPELHKEQIYGNFFEDQIRNADIILVNKTDLADEERIEQTRSIVESLNPGAILFATVNADIGQPLPDLTSRHKTMTHAKPHFAFDTVSLKFGQSVGYSFFRTLFGNIAKGLYGNVVRAKALVRTDRGTFRFDAVYGKEEISPFVGEITEGRLVVIGEDLRKEAVQAAGGGRTLDDFTG